MMEGANEEDPMKLKIVLIPLVLILLMGCTTLNSDGSPRWTTHPPSSWRTYYAVGYARLSNVANSRLSAEANARDAIARWTGTTVDSALTNYVEDYGGGYTLETMQQVSSQTVKISLRGTQTEKQWVAPDGGLYVLVSFPLKYLKEAYKEQSAALVREQELEKAQILIDYLEKELQKEGR